jgi:hypothetical protein
MPITATCSTCGQSYQLADTLFGKKVRCKSCSAIFIAGTTSAPPRSTAIQTSARRPAPLSEQYEPEEPIEDEEPRPRRRGRRKKEGPSGALVAAIVFGIVAWIGLSAVGVWLFFLRTKEAINTAIQNQPAGNQQQSAVKPQPLAAPGIPNPPPPLPPPPPPANVPAGEPAVTLSNAKVTGLGNRMQVTVEYRFTSGGPGGKPVFLLIKPTQMMPHRDNMYEAQLRMAEGTTQGTARVSGMTFGIEHGPFEIWMEQGDPRPPGGGVPGIPEPDRKKISNSVTVETKELGRPGMGPPGMPRGGPRGPRGPRP